MLSTICPPAILYIGFSLTHIIIDIFKKMYNTALLKFTIMVVFTLFLNILCMQGLGIVSWMIVFVPFIMMTYISGLLLYVFGLSPGKGNLNYKIVMPNNRQHRDPRSSYTPGYKNEKRGHLPSHHHSYKHHDKKHHKNYKHDKHHKHYKHHKHDKQHKHDKKQHDDWVNNDEHYVEKNGKEYDINK